MAEPHPLQEADRVRGIGGVTGPTFREGTVEPDLHRPPFSVDTYTVEDACHEIDISRYGYCYEPRGTARVTDAPEVKPEDNGHPDYNKY